MKIPRTIALTLILGVIATAALIAACGSDNNSGGVLNPPAKELDSGDLVGGTGVYSHTFRNVGTFNYHCIHHSGMTGQVIVVVGAPATASVDISDNKFTPTAVSVDTSGTVTWTNTGGNVHTVTSN